MAVERGDRGLAGGARRSGEGHADLHLNDVAPPLRNWAASRFTSMARKGAIAARRAGASLRHSGIYSTQRSGIGYGGVSSFLWSCPCRLCASFCPLSFAGPAVSPCRSARRNFRRRRRAKSREWRRIYLISHPEILRDMATELDRRQKADKTDQRHAMIAHAGKEIFDFDFQAVIGNPEGQGHAGRVLRLQLRLLQTRPGQSRRPHEGDPDLRVVLKDFPVLGPDLPRRPRSPPPRENRFPAKNSGISIRNCC